MAMDEDGKLGFGCMRMPVTDPDDMTSFDYPKIEALFDAFLERGFTYFDTAYTYHGYQAESAVRRALVERHQRDAFQLATKMPLRDFKDSNDLQVIFDEQLANCGVEYFDYYLLHNMGHNVYEKCVKYDAFGFVRRMREVGKIRYTGMSFHDTPELLEKILADYAHCFDFLQLQVNYVDMENPNVQSTRCLEIAHKYGLPVTVMEPCKGGMLVNVPGEVRALFAELNPDASMASWALRFAASQPGVTRVLTGMNDMSQVEQNCATFHDFDPLTPEELSACERAAQIINANVAIGCTGCEYCTHNCPKHIAIPKYFALYNTVAANTGSFGSYGAYYNNISIAAGSHASDCLKCGLCEKNCPQHLPIRDLLEKVAEQFEANAAFPTRK